MLAQRAYWRQQLTDAPAMLELTLDYPRPPQPTGRGGIVGLELEPVQLVGMRALAAGCGATLFMALLAVWQVDHDLIPLHTTGTSVCVCRPGRLLPAAPCIDACAGNPVAHVPCRGSTLLGEA